MYFLSTFALHFTTASSQYDRLIKAKSREIEYKENGKNLSLWRLLFLFTKCFGDYRKFQFWLFLC